MANLQAGVMFGNKHSYNDWGLILVTDDIGFPEATTAIDNLPIWGNPDFDVRKDYIRRTMTFQFGKMGVTRWPNLVQEITAAIHGKKLKIIRDCEPDRYYIGRCFVTAYKSTLRIGKMTIRVDAEPFSYSTQLTENTFSQVTDLTTNCLSDITTPAIITITPQNALVSLTLSGLARDPNTGLLESITINNLASQVPIVIDGYAKTIMAGTANKIADCELWEFPTLKPGANVATVSSAFSVIKIGYRKKYI